MSSTVVAPHVQKILDLAAAAKATISAEEITEKNIGNLVDKHDPSGAAWHVSTRAQRTLGRALVLQSERFAAKREAVTFKKHPHMVAKAEARAEEARLAILALWAPGMALSAAQVQERLTRCLGELTNVGELNADHGTSFESVEALAAAVLDGTAPERVREDRDVTAALCAAVGVDSPADVAGVLAAVTP
jgi:hypothetical protein